MKFNRNNYPQFSNFHPASVVVNGELYKNAEAAFQAGKQREGERDVRFFTATGGAAKRLGRQVLLRLDWEQIKYSHMRECVYAKFNQNPELGDLLLSTGYEWLVEDTSYWHDNTWGACSCNRCANKISYNLLGQALMEVRAYLRRDKGVPVIVRDAKGGVAAEFDLVGEDVAKLKASGEWDKVLNIFNRYC